MPFITNYNLRAIIWKIDFTKVVNEEFNEFDFRWFSKLEVNELLSFKCLFSSPEELLKKYTWKESSKNQSYLQYIRNPCYHQNSDCYYMQLGFDNYKITSNSHEIDNSSKQKFELWLKENRHLISNQTELLNQNFKTKFGANYSLEKIHLSNSGYSQINNLSLIEIECLIHHYVNQANKFYLDAEEHKIILDNFGKNSFIHKNKQKPYLNETPFSNELIWETLKEFDEDFKAPIIENIREYYRIKFNPTLKFDENILDQLGFNPCLQCHDEDYIKSYAQWK